VKELDEKGLLLRALAEPRFRLIFVPYSHYNTVRFVKQLLTDHYSERSIHEIDLEKQTVPTIIPLLEQIESGILYLYNFDILLKSEHLRTYLNQRRDWLASRPLAIIAFVNNGANIPLLAKGIKDLYSFRTLVLYDLEKEEGTAVKTGELSSLQLNETSSGFGPEIEAKVAELYERWKEVLVKKDDENLMMLLLEQLVVMIREYSIPELKLGQLHLLENDMKIVYKDELAPYAKALLHYHLGLAYTDSGNYSQSRDQILRALELEPTNRTYLIGFSHLLQKMGEHDKAIEILLRFIHADDKLINGDEEYADLYNSLGTALYSKGDHTNALSYFEKALEIYKKIYGNYHTKVAMVLNNMGGSFAHIDDNGKALANYKEALAIWEKILGQMHPTIAIVLNNIGYALHNLNDYSKAIDYYQKALSIDLKVLGKEHPNIATRLNNLGNIYLELGDYEKASNLFKEALSILKKVHPEGHLYINLVKESIDKTFALQTAQTASKDEKPGH
jgi:tetratricopeptide (TPR) repeat protein